MFVCFVLFILSCSLPPSGPVGLVVKFKASAPREADPVSIPVFSVMIFPGRVIPVSEKLARQCLAYQAPGVVGSALGLVG